MEKNLIAGLFFLLLSVCTIQAYGQTCNSNSDCPQGLWCYVYVTGSGECKQCESSDPSWHPCPSGYLCDFNDQCVVRECSAHCDCEQGSFCYYGKCLRDPKTPVYCCTDSSGQPKAGCPPGRWCFEPTGSKGTCAESSSHVCQSACDCGPAHCCKYDPAVGHSVCVKDSKDPWNPGGSGIDGLSCEQGVDATYCCEDPLCHAGMYAYGFSELFRCESMFDGSVHDICGGKSCGSACDCDPGESCIDIKGQPRPPFGKVCDTSFSMNPAEPSAVCASNAVAEAVYGVSPAELISCCGKGCFPGQKCEVGWVQGGGYLLERVVGVCGGGCGNGTWDPGESAISCPSDCLQPPRYPDCGAMSNAYSFYFAMCGDGSCDQNGYTPENCMTCPHDCGVVCPQPVALCKDVTVNAGLTCTASASINNGSYIPGGSPITLTQSPTGPYPKGDTLVTLTVTNTQGASTQCTGIVTVIDEVPPTISNASVIPSTLWPPNHQMVPVTLTVTATDNCGGTPVCKIISVSSNEPINGLGDGDTAPDWQVTGNLTVNLRSERSGKGNGRIYTINLKCGDAAGNLSNQGRVTVNVPKSQKK